jgi:hypothetical protein
MLLGEVSLVAWSCAAAPEGASHGERPPRELCACALASRRPLHVARAACAVALTTVAEGGRMEPTALPAGAAACYTAESAAACSMAEAAGKAAASSSLIPDGGGDLLDNRGGGEGCCYCFIR